MPHTHVRQTLSVLAEEQCLRILDGTQELAVYVRSWDKAAQIENPVHIQPLVECKRKARAHRACDRLSAAVPASTELLRLLARYSAAALQAAKIESLAYRS